MARATRAALSVAGLFSAATAKDLFTVQPACGQFGTEPGSLEASLVAGYDYNCREPTNWVKKYHTTDLFPGDGSDVAADDDGFDTDALMEDYLPELYTPLACLFVFGFISFLWLSIWSCGTMGCCIKKNCCCAKCCKSPFACTQRHPGDIVIVVVCFLLATCAFGIGLAGWRNNKAQNDAVDGVSSIMQIMTQWADGATTAISSTDAKYAALISDAKAFQAAAASQTTTEFRAITDEVCPEITSALTDARGGITTMDEVFNDISDLLDDAADSFEDQVDTINGYRNSAVLSVWVVLISLVVFSIFSIVAKKIKPTLDKKLRCCFRPVAFCYLFVILLLTFVAVALLAANMVLADFCIEPIKNYQEMMALENTTFGYFTDCDVRTQHVDGSTYANPFNADVQTVLVGSSESLGELTDLEQSLGDTRDDINANVGKTSAYKTKAGSEFDVLKSNIASLKTSIAAVTASTATGCTVQGCSSGILSSLQCYALLPRTNAVMNQMCGPLHSSVAQQFEYLTVALVFLIIVDVLRRLGRPDREKSGLSASKVLPIAQEPAEGKQDQYDY